MQLNVMRVVLGGRERGSGGIAFGVLCRLA